MPDVLTGESKRRRNIIELIERFLTVTASDIEIFLPAVDPSGGGRTKGAA
mgnify:CR=1 FL=1